MDLRVDPELVALAADVRAVATAGTRDLDLREDSWLIGHDRAFALELGARGWLGMTLPQEFGGHARSALERFIVTEALIEAGAPIASAWIADRQIAPAILAFGSDDQRRRYLPPIAAGSVQWSVGMSEAGAGSDLAHLRTAAIEDGDQFVVNGAKVWTSFATTADLLYLICRTDPSAEAHKGLSELIVDLRSPGITVSPIRDLSGGADFCEIVLDQVRVPRDNLVGTLNGSWQQTLRQLESERGGIDRLLSNRALYLDALELADTTDPVVRQRVARLETAYLIGRQLVLRTLLGPKVPGRTALTKTFGTELAQDVADFASWVAGPDAMLVNRWSRSACYSQGYTIMGGTANILRNIAAERILGLPR